MGIHGFRTQNSELSTQNKCVIHPSLSSTRPHHPPVPIIHPSPSSTRPHHTPVPIIHPSPSSTHPHHPPFPIIHPSPSSTRPHHPPIPIIHPSPSSTRPHHPPVPTLGIRGSLRGHFWHTRVTLGPPCGTLGSLWYHFGLMCGLLGAERRTCSKSVVFQRFFGG